jgi:hypothetical protein
VHVHVDGGEYQATPALLAQWVCAGGQLVRSAPLAVRVVQKVVVGAAWQRDSSGQHTALHALL